jgi:hypothetical protein
MATSPPPTQSATASGNRFARFTPENHSAPIWIASILSPIFACLILAVRLGIVKWNVHGLDDVLLTLAHVSSQKPHIPKRLPVPSNRLTDAKLVGLGMWASLFSALSNGLGKALKLLSVDEISRMNQVNATYPHQLPRERQPQRRNRADGIRLLRLVILCKPGSTFHRARFIEMLRYCLHSSHLRQYGERLSDHQYHRRRRRCLGSGRNPRSFYWVFTRSHRSGTREHPLRQRC